MAGGRALILAGTGMLTMVVRELACEGWQVVLPSRRYVPISGGEAKPGAAARRAPRTRGYRRTGMPGTVTWVEAQWDRPRQLAREAEQALGGPADLLAAWVHESYRQSVIGAVERLLAPGAPVVEVRGGTGIDAIAVPDPLLIEHSTQQVLLGAVSERDSDRSLTHAEIVEGVLAAVWRALEGMPSSLQQIGRPRPLAP